VQLIPTATDSIRIQFTPGTHGILSLRKKAFAIWALRNGGGGVPGGGDRE
jgi:hypothetical protein